MKYQLPLAGMTVIKKTNDDTHWREYCEKETLAHCGLGFQLEQMLCVCAAEVSRSTDLIEDCMAVPRENKR